ncbi:MAG: hypothetical protein RL322_2095 [Pseudomonadota bacterium]|jgi:uncharacterized MAPEG superfamily protein
MTLAFWCVLAAALLPYVFAGIAKVGDTPYDNRAPRRYLDSVQGRQQRAHWAQLNSYEAFPPFAAGVIIAHLCEAPQTQIDGLGVAFVLFRIAYGWAYITDRATLRSVVWLGGVASVVGLFVVGA